MKANKAKAKTKTKERTPKTQNQNNLYDFFKSISELLVKVRMIGHAIRQRAQSAPRHLLSYAGHTPTNIYIL